MKNIHARVRHLIQKFNTRNPAKIAKYINIHVKYTEYSYGTKGFFIKTLRNKFIIVNSTLDEESQRIILAHELGHALLHYNEPISIIREYTFFPIGPFEREANKFAAELLIPDDELRLDLSISEMSQLFGLPEELIKYKLNLY
ncbi:ImmA/IrrE family metallo-endopeptidase [Tepidanaerobacter syntrophicus]|uniref:ImmA/IrrE family metallo-endopeptidase n=1 Tax=Tepidanaerobacter syntrophicus TaxID=224999 RepID=UPI001BD587E3|nr:ImmA/IrrE family metallo-endopeptidase [Tepidanaerobacter syntrophicus]